MNNMTHIRFFFTLLALNLVSMVFAQESFSDKGIIYVRGTGQLLVSFEEGSPINLSAGGGYFFWRDWLLGADIGYSKVGDSSNTSFAPFARYYIKQKFFAEARYLSFKEREESFSYIEAGGGYVYLLNDYVALEPGLFLPFSDGGKPYIKVILSIYF